MIKKVKILFFLTALVASTNGLSVKDSKHWLNTCKPDNCSTTAFSLCLNCSGKLSCNSCLTKNKPECSSCADSIFNKNNLETINGNDYLVCDSKDLMQTKVCHFYCRGQYAQSGQCVSENNLPICKCSSQSESFATEKPTQSTTKATFSFRTNVTVTASTHSSTKKFASKLYTRTARFNGTIKLRILLTDDYFIILPLPNGDLVRGSRSNYIQIWDIEKGVVKRNLTSSGYSHPIVFGLLSNSDLVAGYMYSRALLIWDVKLTNGEPLKRIVHINESIQYLTVLKNDDLAIGQDFFLKNYDIVIRDSKIGSIKKRLVGHTKTVYEIIEMENGNLLSSSSDKTVKVWDVNTGAILNSISHTDYVHSSAILKNGYLALGFISGTIAIWNLETNKLIRNSLEFH